jgi:hypothetical protein
MCARSWGVASSHLPFIFNPLRPYFAAGEPYQQTRSTLPWPKREAQGLIGIEAPQGAQNNERYKYTYSVQTNFIVVSVTIHIPYWLADPRHSASIRQKSAHSAWPVWGNELLIDPDNSKPCPRTK